MKAINFKIILRKNQINTDGSNSVCLIISYNRVRKLLSLDIKVKESDWLPDKFRVKKTDPEHERKNLLITEYRNRATNIIDNVILSRSVFSLDSFEKAFKSNYFGEDDFIEFATNQLKQRSSLAKETQRTYLSQITKIKQFKQKIKFGDIDLKFIEDYKMYMINELKNTPITMYKSLSMLRTFCNWAIEEGKIKDNQFKKIKIKKLQGKREHLKLFEIEKLETLLQDENLHFSVKESLRIFLFDCFTGLRIKDIRLLKGKHLIKKDEFNFIDISQHKTGNNVMIPLINRAAKYLPQNIKPNEFIFKPVSLNKTNRSIKKCCKIVGINKRITFHCARHSLATNLINEKVNIEIISLILGHTDIRTTRIYARASNETKFDALKKLETK